MRALQILGRRGDVIREGALRELGALLGETPSEANLQAAAARAHALLDEAHENAKRRAPALEPACSAGCAHCCHVHAYATAPEIFAVAHYLRSRLSPEKLEEVRERLAARAREAGPLSDEARWAAKIPCALLDARGRCSIYEARPLRCRAFHSLSVEVCRDAFEGQTDAGPLTAPLLDRAVNAVEDGWDHALAGAGLSAEGYRLEIALDVALADPRAAARWLAGEVVFESARADP